MALAGSTGTRFVSELFVSQCRGVVAALGLIVLLIAILVPVIGSASEPSETGPETQTFTLRPGDNFVGWVAEAKPVAEIFAEIPQARLIYRWDADTRSWQYAIRGVGGNLDALESGMAAKILISGTGIVEWRRPLAPVKGMVTLYSGVNWVAWNGRDEWPLDQVARGIGTSLVSIEVRGQVYQPNSDVSEVVGPLMGEATIRRGDALRVTVNRDLRWLQPTGMTPNIVWVGDISQSLQDKITTDIRRVVDFFAEEFAVETDFSETTALIWMDVDAAVKYAESGAEPQFGGSSDSLRSNLTHHHLAAGRPWGFYVPACGWQPSCPAHGRQQGGILTLVHEWFHLLQSQLSAGDQRVSPVWMIEGPAIWAEWQLPTDLRNHPYESNRKWRLDATARATATLQSTEQPYTRYAYQLGAIAAERLAEQRGIIGLSNHPIWSLLVLQVVPILAFLGLGVEH